jgi:hypothetical protein
MKRTIELTPAQCRNCWRALIYCLQSYVSGGKVLVDVEAVELGWAEVASAYFPNGDDYPDNHVTLWEHPDWDCIAQDASEETADDIDVASLPDDLEIEVEDDEEEDSDEEEDDDEDDDEDEEQVIGDLRKKYGVS